MTWGDSLADGMDDAYLVASIDRLEQEIIEMKKSISGHKVILRDLRQAYRTRQKKAADVQSPTSVRKVPR